MRRILYVSVQKGDTYMKTVNLTEFRSRASGMLTEVEQGETFIVLRHGRPIAQVSPVSKDSEDIASWKRPGLRLSTKGHGLASAILEERDRENLL